MCSCIMYSVAGWKMNLASDGCVRARIPIWAKSLKILGNPNKIVDLGAKQTYVYSDMKIVFKDGVVADVQ